ncbi:hypothetical protein NSB1T_06135 [Coprobacter fastidiosus NSB1 = JCM 33896]|nr:hypothetical protein NSB1T_06135 [Coprobacter fastidiosus NSB1 = JCM 33896]
MIPYINFLTLRVLKFSYTFHLLNFPGFQIIGFCVIMESF